MLDWLYLALNDYGTSSSARLDRVGRRAPAWLIRCIAAAKLARTLRHVWRHCAYQRDRWRRAGVRAGDLGSPRVLPRLPFLDPDELTEHPEQFFCVPERALTHIMTTSGTGGRSRKIYFTTEDIDYQARLLGAALRQLPGASRVLVLMGSLEPVWGPGDMARRAAECAGMMGLLVPKDGAPADHVDYVREYHPDVLIGTPNWVHRITLEVDADLKSLGVRYIVLSGQPMPSGLRATLEDAWGATVIDLYATNECACGIASQCVDGGGLHLAETDFWIEIVDPDTGEVVPEGEEGEIVITTLSRVGMPLLRYRIGDLSRLLPRTGRCTCGLALRKIAPITGRVDHMLILGSGFNVYPDAIDDAIFSVSGVADYQLTVTKDGFRDVLDVTVETAAPENGLYDQLRGALLEVKYIRHNVENRGHVVFGAFKTVPPGTLSAGRRKTVRIVDKRA